jgi:hypothetical protein
VGVLDTDSARRRKRPKVEACVRACAQWVRDDTTPSELLGSSLASMQTAVAITGGDTGAPARASVATE